MDLTPNHLSFSIEAGSAFKEDPNLTTWRNKDDTLIALRHGEYRTEMVIYSIEKVVGFIEYLPAAGAMKASEL